MPTRARSFASHLAPLLAVRLLRITGTVIVTAVVVFLSLLLAIRYFVFPALDDYRDRIAAALTRDLGQPVSIDGIAGGWDGWNPRLSIRGFAIREKAKPDGPPVLLLPQVDATVAWTSLVALKLRLRELSIERPQLAIRRDKSGRFHVAGFEIETGTQRDDSPITEWLLDQSEIVVRDALVMWNDEVRGAPQLVLDHVMFRLEQSFGRIRFGLTGSPPAQLASPLELRGEVGAASLRSWSETRGRFYMRLDYADVALWREWFAVLKPVETGEGAVRVWFDVVAGKPVNVVADLELTDARLRVRPDLPLLDLVFVRGHLTWQHDNGKMTFGTRDLTFRARNGQELAPVALSVSMDEGSDGAISGGKLEFDRLEVAPLSTLGEHLPLPEHWRRDLAALALRGSVSGGKLAWSGPPEAPTKFSASGAFTRFGIAASAGLPGAASVSGNFTFDEARGDLKLDSRDMRVSLPRVFADELLFTTASGRVSWTREDESLRVAVEDIRFVTPHTSGTASGSWKSRERGPGLIDLRAQLARGDAQHIYRYLPLTLSDGVRDWLRTSIKQGVATDIRMALSGDLSDFPFTDAKKGQFRVTFKAGNAALDYADGWPGVTDIDGDVRFEGPGLAINVKSARILGVSLGPVKVDIPDLGVQHPALTIAGDAAGATSDFLRFVDKSPVGGWIGGFSEGAHATGNGKLALKFTLPLGNPEGVKVSGDYEFIANALRLPGVPALAQVNGHLEFAERGTQSRDLTAEVFGGLAKIAVSAQEGGVRVIASGSANLATVASEFDVPMRNRISGVHRLAARGAIARHAVELGDRVEPQGRQHRVPGADRQAAGGDGAGSHRASRVDRKRPRRHADDRLPRQPAPDRASRSRQRGGQRRPGAPAPRRRDGARRCSRPSGTLGSRRYRGLRRRRVARALCKRVGQGTRRGRQGERARAQWRGHPGGAPGRVRSRAARPQGRRNARRHRVAPAHRRPRARGNRDVARSCTWAAQWPRHGAPVALRAPRTRRAAARAQRDRYRPRSRRTPGPSSTSRPAPSSPGAGTTSARSSSSLSRWGRTGASASCRSRIRPGASTPTAGGASDGRSRAPSSKCSSTTEDAGAFLDRLGFPVAVRNAPSNIAGSLVWAGAPNDFDYPSLGGKLTLRTGAGQFTKIDPGIGKLLGVLSLQALPRRITLDFRDVFSEGFAFDDIHGDFRIEKGLMRTENLALAGPAAKVTLTGSIDLASETQELDVRVKPALSSTLSAGAAVLFLANPIVGAAVGAGTLLAQKLMNDPLDQLFSYDYRVTGSWSDPQVARVGSKVVSTSPPAQR